VVIISYAQACLLGMLQGLTEFLPVSSTAHMAVVPQVAFHMGDPGAAFSAVVQLGPIVAIIAYFRADLMRYAKGVVRHPRFWQPAPSDIDARLGWYVVFGTLPLVVGGIIFEHWIDTVFRGLYVIAGCLILLAFVLWYAEVVATRSKTLEHLTWARSLIIGCAQVLALVPGASRSGVTIAAGLFQGLDRESAARFSFLLSIPAITLAGLYKLVKVLRATHLGSQAGPYVFGAIVAGVVAYVVVRWFLGYMKEHSTGLFIGYRIVLGALLLALLQTGYVKSAAGPESAQRDVTSTLTATAMSTAPPSTSMRLAMRAPSLPPAAIAMEVIRTVTKPATMEGHTIGARMSASHSPAANPSMLVPTDTISN
jgi:undecaprenyl-diphosphatase